MNWVESYVYCIVKGRKFTKMPSKSLNVPEDFRTLKRYATKYCRLLFFVAVWVVIASFFGIDLPQGVALGIINIGCCFALSIYCPWQGSWAGNAMDGQQ
ncbi:hypothetical protein L207DRAFT_119586 [Hyaloscypha variabilis F]|uniref:Uncharacterized protein n=1 Tax=Hyaloscypha variabilis (strain UAMH 11265 / GT02V1 / F) TaxID=1149755 RepID=A0A2J6RAV3_HYAVF|nr:hypothetical protein L207DRAFT_119586 [Hyaloscypha variabilis F]